MIFYVVKLYKLKEREHTKNDDEDGVVPEDDDHYQNPPQTPRDQKLPNRDKSILYTDVVDTTIEPQDTNTSLNSSYLSNQSLIMDLTKNGTYNNARASPHKMMANELLRRNAETKEMLRAKTSSLLQELNITKQLVRISFFSLSSLALTSLFPVPEFENGAVGQSSENSYFTSINSLNFISLYIYKTHCRTFHCYLFK